MRNAFGPGSAYDALPTLPALRRTFVLDEQTFHALHSVQVAVHNVTGERVGLDDVLAAIVRTAAEELSEGQENGKGGQK